MNITDYISKQLQAGEEVVTVVRRHPATLIPGLLLGGGLTLIDFFLVAWWFRHGGWGVIGFLLLLVVGTILVIRTIFIWSHNAMAVTTHRVIDIDQRGMFERNVAEATYDKVQDVRYTVRGLWSTLFHFGTIVVQTAGNTTNLELEAVRNPVELQQIITDTQRRRQSAQPDDVSATELLKVVDRLKRDLGPDGLDRLLRQRNSPHGQN